MMAGLLLVAVDRVSAAERLVAGNLAGHAAMIELAEEVLAGHCKQLRHLDISGNYAHARAIMIYLTRWDARK